MENHLRLAERQGLLRGPLSPVQQEALRLLIYADNRQRIHDEDEAVKLAVLAAGQRTPQDLWPERYDAAPAKVVVDETPDTFMDEIPDGADYSAVQWIAPDDPEFAEAMRIHEMLGDTAVTVREPVDERAGEWL